MADPSDLQNGAAPSGYGEHMFNIYRNKLLGGEAPPTTTDPSLLEKQAKEAMPEEGFNYVAGGAGEGSTMEANRLAFRQWKLIPRMMRPALDRDMRVELFGHTYESPLLMAPVGVMSAYHQDKELGVASACADLRVPFIISTAASSSIEEIAEHVGNEAPRWFQLYWPRSESLTASLLKRAHASGCKVLVVTLDTFTMAWRPRDLDLGYLPFVLGEGNANGFSDPEFRKMFARAQKDKGNQEGDEEVTPDDNVIEASLHWISEAFSGEARRWEDIAILKRHWDGPVVLKGIVSVEDAKLALKHGADGIVVSNHGGRQLDGSIASLEVLPEIVDAVGDKMTVLFDSGVRTGADAMKALCLGAKGVLVGRPVIYGLGIAGKEGAKNVLAGLLADLHQSMGLAGVKSVKELTRGMVRRVKYGGDVRSVLLYPRATEGRLTFHNSHKKRWRPPGRPFFRAAAINFVLLQLLFLGLFSYVFGSLFQQQSHTHNISVAFVDYDKGGAIGDAVRKAYESLKGDSFPTLYERSAADFPGPTDLRDAVCSTTYWAALYVEPGASDRLRAALAGGPPALAYNRSDVLTYVWNEALYSTVVDAAIASPLQALSNAARIAYSTAGAGGTAGRQLSSAEAVAVFADPWQLASVDIQPTTQGSRAIYNTLVIILILIQEFFYLGTINGLYASFKVYVRIHPYRIILVRNAISAAYTLVGSLCVAGSIWAFRSGWDVSGAQLALTWMALWLFAHLNFLTLDVFTVWLPLAYVPMALISWVILNVTSILLPFALSPAFYRVGYALPAHEVYQVLTDIWSRGCNPQLHYALPVMVAWKVAGLCLSALGVFRRSHYALLGEEEQARQFQEKIDAAVAFEKRRYREREGEQEEEEEAEEEEAEEEEAEEEEKRREEAAAAAAATGDGSVQAVSSAESVEAPRERRVTRQSSEHVREELAEAIEAEDVRLRRAQSRASRVCHFGPSFDLAFDQLGEDDDSEET